MTDADRETARKIQEEFAPMPVISWAYELQTQIAQALAAAREEGRIEGIETYRQKLIGYKARCWQSWAADTPPRIVAEGEVQRCINFAVDASASRRPS